MSDITIWGYPAHLVLEISEDEAIEVLGAVQMMQGNEPTLVVDTHRVLEAVSKAQERRPPLFKPVKWSG